MSSSSSSNTNWAEFLTSVDSNQFLQNNSTDTSLQPGEEYPTAPHPYMVLAGRNKDATMNQIATLLSTSAEDVPSVHRPKFLARQTTAQTKWPYPYTEENPCSTQLYKHWETRFNMAIVQIVSTQFRRDKHIPKEGNDLFSQGTTKFTSYDSTADAGVTSQGLQLCQPLFMKHMYYVRQSTLTDLAAFAL